MPPLVPECNGAIAKYGMGLTVTQPCPFLQRGPTRNTVWILKLDRSRKQWTNHKNQGGAPRSCEKKMQKGLNVDAAKCAKITNVFPTTSSKNLTVLK